jgi:hypothetical protein
MDVPERGNPETIAILLRFMLTLLVKLTYARTPRPAHASAPAPGPNRASPAE